MQTIKAILTRRSVRSYTDKKVKEQDIEDMLRAAMYAPSANNRQPRHFVVIENRGLLDEIPNIHPHAKMLKEAPLAILVCADTEAQDMAGYYSQDCSAATQNILLAAHEKGLGAVWLGVYPREERMKPVRELFDLPGNIVPFSLISIGHYDKKLPDVERYDKSRVHWNSWK